ncbi:MAG: DegT/DnrJ/EryC1/StrS family aminotransferase [Lautropia sp.]
MIPQADPGAGYRARQAEIDAAIATALASGWYILGKEVTAFEREFADWLGTQHAIGVANGTDAITLALRGLGIGPGDAVATVSHTAVATVAAIEMAGATPVLVDIDPDHYTMSADALQRAIAAQPAGAPIRAVVVVHLYGQPADLDAIVAIARAHGLRIVEDCAQAHGAVWRGIRVGCFGDAAAFSLYPTKNLAALGDGGIVATGDAAVAERIAALRQYGWRERYISAEAGVNSRLDELQAAVLRVRLRHLDGENARRQAIAACYDAALVRAGAAPPHRRAGAEHVFHQYVIASDARDALQARLRAAGIGTNVHYPLPVHRQPAYQGRVAIGPDGLARSERAAATVLSLPMFPQLADAQIDAVCAALVDAAAHGLLRAPV